MAKNTRELALFNLAIDSFLASNLESSFGSTQPKPAGDDGGEIFNPYLQRMAAFWQATLGRLRLDPAKTRHPK